MSKRKQKKRQNKVQTLVPLGGSLVERADTVEMLYNTLGSVAQEDIDGIKRGYVDVEPDRIVVRSQPSAAAMNAYYGVDSVSVATMQDPFPMMPQRNIPEEDDPKERFDRGLLRQALRRIVDEV